MTARVHGPTVACVSGCTSNAQETSRYAALHLPLAQMRSSSSGIIGMAVVKPCAQTTMTLTAALKSTCPH
jgi:hypothetical protein